MTPPSSNGQGVGPALPDAAYLSLSSRLIPGLDGGYTVATLARARQLEQAGARPVSLLTLDPGAPDPHAEQRAEFVRRGDAASTDRFRNLFDEAIADPSWLRAAAVPGERSAGIEYRDIVDADGATVLSIPVIPGDPDWYRTEAAVDVVGAGSGVLVGFRGLYRAWLEHVVAGLRAEDPARIVVVVCESRQLGELLADWSAPGVRIVHTIHNSHLEPPYDDPDGPIGELWRRWFAVAPAFDAVLWPTAAQRDDVAARFGDPGTFHVVPNAIDLGSEPPDAASRDPHRVVMLNRLAAQKRIDVAIRAWPRVLASVPDARLDVYGAGPLRDELGALVAELGLAASVGLHGATSDRDAVFDRAALFLTTTAFEGQGLSLAEALARGLPVVSTDVRYGPREAVGDAGILVPPGDPDAVADAVVTLLTDETLRADLSSRARVAARAFTSQVVTPALVAAIRDAVASPSRRI